MNKIATSVAELYFLTKLTTGKFPCENLQFQTMFSRLSTVKAEKLASFLIEHFHKQTAKPWHFVFGKFDL